MRATICAERQGALVEMLACFRADKGRLLRSYSYNLIVRPHEWSLDYWVSLKMHFSTMAASPLFAATLFN